MKEIHPIVEGPNNLNRGTISIYCNGNRAIEDLVVDIYILGPNLQIDWNFEGCMLAKVVKRGICRLYQSSLVDEKRYFKSIHLFLYRFV